MFLQREPMLTEYSECKSSTLFQPVHFLLLFLSLDLEFSRIITDSIYFCYFAFKKNKNKAIKAAVQKGQWEKKNHQTYLLKLVFLMTLKKLFNTDSGNNALNLHHAQKTELGLTEWGWRSLLCSFLLHWSPHSYSATRAAAALSAFRGWIQGTPSPQCKPDLLPHTEPLAFISLAGALQNQLPTPEKP